MPTIITFTPLAAPSHATVKGRGRLVAHRCEDVAGHKHHQRLPLGSVGGVLYLDALCLYCGKHFVWVEEEDSPAAA